MCIEMTMVGDWFRRLEDRAVSRVRAAILKQNGRVDPLALAAGAALAAVFNLTLAYLAWTGVNAFLG